MPIDDRDALVFLLALLIDGALAGAVYALIALAFVLIYKASRMINFAIGEWIMYGALLSAAGGPLLGLGIGGAIAFACVGMAALGLGFNRLVVRRLVARPAIAAIMVTLGLGAVMRGSAPLLFAGTGAPSLPFAADAVAVFGVRVGADKLAAAAVAALCVGLVGALWQWSRTGVALRAIADDPQAALAAGIDVDRHFALVWAATGIVSVIAGVLWTAVAGAGFGVVLVGLKVFPIVIIGGLDSIPGTIVAAMAIGVLESLGAGYLDPALGGGFGNVASYLLLLAMLAMRPFGLFGRRQPARV